MQKYVLSHNFLIHEEKCIHGLSIHLEEVLLRYDSNSFKIVIVVGIEVVVIYCWDVSTLPSLLMPLNQEIILADILAVDDSEDEEEADYNVAAKEIFTTIRIGLMWKTPLLFHHNKTTTTTRYCKMFCLTTD
jgi:hypothetical protein